MSHTHHYVHTVVFGDKTYTRVSEHVYSHASHLGHGSMRTLVAFHHSYAAAKRRAGRFGEVKPVTVSS